MKRDIHPTVHTVTAHCACGNVFKTTSTKKDLSSTLCSACHPFFTGAQKFIDTAGRIDKFKKKYNK
ncbi:MAG: 50S ribosomal protein L31 [Candidatus Amoebophilus sp.]